MKEMHASISGDNRLLSDDQADRVIDRVVEFMSKKEQLTVTVNSLWYGSQRWARNRAFETSNVQKIRVSIEVLRGFKDARAEIFFNQIDDKSLRDACSYLEKEMDHQYKRGGFNAGMDMKLGSPKWEARGIPVWSDATYNRNATENSELVTSITERAESKGLMCAGSIDTLAAHFVGYTRDPWLREEREKGHATMAECSTTVRHPKGVGSGWVGASSFDITRLDLVKLGEVALDKCVSSIDAVRIEPGRYQTILEPQATAFFALCFFDLFRYRPFTEGQGHPFFNQYDPQVQRGRSRLGLMVADRRLSISHDPEDPITGSHTYKSIQKIDFLKNGILESLARSFAEYSLPELSVGNPILPRRTFEMTSNEITNLDEMISTMKRGLLMTRVSGGQELDGPSALYTGLTRDGLWLIENGKISKAVRNFRWTESPVFIFNNVDAIGKSVPVMSSWNQQFPFTQRALHDAVPSIVVPTIKINDFSFTSTVDAI